MSKVIHAGHIPLEGKGNNDDTENFPSLYQPDKKTEKKTCLATKSF